MSPEETQTTEAPTEAPAEEKQPKKTAAKKEAKMTVEDLVEAVKGMTVLELSQLVKQLETTFGISAAPAAGPAATATGAAAGAEAAAPVEEQTEFTVILKEIGANKISVIKAVREVTGLGLKEAKELVEAAPKAVKEGIAKADAAAVKEKLEAAGAKIEVK